MATDTVAKLKTESKEVRVLTGTVAYTDTTAKQLFLLPNGAKIVDVQIDVTTAFDDTGTDYLSVGIPSNDDIIVNDADVSSAGRVALGASFIGPQYEITALNGDFIVAIYAGQASNAANGAATVSVLFTEKTGTRI